MVNTKHIMNVGEKHDLHIRQPWNHHPELKYQQFSDTTTIILGGGTFNLEIDLEDAGPEGYHVVEFMLRSPYSLIGGKRWCHAIGDRTASTQASAVSTSSGRKPYGGFYVMCYSKVNGDANLSDYMFGSGIALKDSYLNAAGTKAVLQFYATPGIFKILNVSGTLIAR